MKRLLSAALIVLAGLGTASARDSVVKVALADVLAMPEAQGKLDGSVKFFLAGAATPKVQQRLGSGVANKKTNGVGKDDQYGCKYVMLSALIAFQQSAKQRGANAVVDLASYYKKNEVRDAHTIECHAGNIMIGGALKGEYAKI
ncbi:MAG: excinuclease ATPase subunit [Xanthomonadales bacterium]|nr:excinuclease ATPase subunit [Xanthomonadales bacterium]MCC6561095.1 excinuclease ATPase subunit [Xanthomonadales bacterium]